MIYCVICLENFKIYDLVRMMRCGHYYHNYCFIKYASNRCAICRQLIQETTTVCFCTDSNTGIIDTDKECFKKLMDFNTRNSMITSYQKTIDNERLKRENLQEHQKIFYSFFQENLIDFRFKLLQAVSEKKTSVLLYSCDFTEKFKDLPLIYILNGPKSLGTSFFRINKIKSFVDILHEEFGVDIFVNSDYVSRTNHLKAYFTTLC